MKNLTPRLSTAALIILAAILSIALSAGAVASAQEKGGDRDRDLEPVPGNPTVKVLPPESPRREGRWVLGVRVDPLDVGVRIREVIPRSAAARGGLERNDVIIAINGYQIGRVLNRDYPIEWELERRANDRGEVRLLVQDHRTSRLVNIDVRLDGRWEQQRETVIRGEVDYDYRDRMAMPKDTELRLELVRRTPFSRDTVAHETYRNVGNPPIPFEFRYRTEYLDPEGRYELRAEVWSRGRRVLVSDRPYPVRLGVDEDGVRILMRPD